MLIQPQSSTKNAGCSTFFQFPFYCIRTKVMATTMQFQHQNIHSCQLQLYQSNTQSFRIHYHCPSSNCGKNTISFAIVQYISTNPVQNGIQKMIRTIQKPKPESNNWTKTQVPHQIIL